MISLSHLKICFLLIFFLTGMSFSQLKLRHPSNVRYIASGYENKSPYFSSLESALNDVYSSVSTANPYVFWIDGDTSLIKDWKHGMVNGRMGMADSIDIYYVAGGKIKWAGFISGNRGSDYSLPILYNPDDRTEYYGYPKWRYEAYTSWYDFFSMGLDSIDRDIHDLIVYTDTSWLYIQNDTLKIKDSKIPQLSAGSKSFQGNAASDTLFITGAKPTDIYFVSPSGPCPTCGDKDYLRIQAVNNKAIVWRNTGGTQNLTYYWIRIAK